MLTPHMVHGAKLLRAFLEKTGIAQAAAARAVDVEPASFHAWVSGRSRPRGHLRDALAIWTRDAVPVSSWDTAEERQLRARMRPMKAS